MDAFEAGIIDGMEKVAYKGVAYRAVRRALQSLPPGKLLRFEKAIDKNPLAGAAAVGIGLTKMVPRTADAALAGTAAAPVIAYGAHRMLKKRRAKKEKS